MNAPPCLRPLRWSLFFVVFSAALVSSFERASAEVIWRGDFETGTTEQWRGAAAKSPAAKIVREPVRAGR
jgi:hypothetical protein